MATVNSLNDVSTAVSKLKCGIIMPISTIDGCPEHHWVDVKSILFEAIEAAGLTPNLVSDADDVGIIQKRIIQNLYENPIVVCGVSGKNPNVMFELGIRLAFDKPTIIVKDDKTTYSFHTSPIEHLEYPRDLRFGKIIGFKSGLGEKLNATLSKASTDPSYTTFLKHFGTFTVAQVETTQVSKEDFLIDQVQELRSSITSLRRDINRRDRQPLRMNSTGRTNARELIRDAIRHAVSELPPDSRADPSPYKDMIALEVEERIDAKNYFTSFNDFRRAFDDVFEGMTFG